MKFLLVHFQHQFCPLPRPSLGRPACILRAILINACINWLSLPFDFVVGKKKQTTKNETYINIVYDYYRTYFRLVTLLSSPFYFFLSSPRLGCLIAVNFLRLRLQCEITARQRQLCVCAPSFICPFIIATCRSLPICSSSNNNNVPHMAHAAATRQFVHLVHNICKTFAMILN